MIAIIDLTRHLNESQRSYIWRIGQAKDDGECDMTWEQLTPTINSALDTTCGESVFRKRYAEGVGWWNEVFQYVMPEEHLKQLRADTRELQKERVKLRDERMELNRSLRNCARDEVSMSTLEDYLKAVGKEQFRPILSEQINGDCDLLICVSDWHIGIEFDSYGGKYNSDIAKDRINQYLGQIIEIQKRHNAKNAHVAILGDILSGAIHPTIAIANRENVIEQVMLASELMAAFIYELSKTFDSVQVSSVSGNHSRLTQDKKVSLIGERLDSLVTWYVKAKLAHIKNISINSQNEDFSGTLDVMKIRGFSYVLNHGDFDELTEAGIAKLITYLGFVPTAVISGHKHTPCLVMANGITGIRSGSLSGSGDDYTVQHRLVGKPSQTVCVCDDNGINCVYPVMLN